MQEFVIQILSTMRRMWKFRWPAVAVAWAVALVGLGVVWKIPNQYEASARIYVDTDSILKPLMSGLAVQPNVDQQIGMLSRTLISRPNIEKLVRMSDLDLKISGKNDQEALIERLMKGIEIRTAGGVNLYSLAYRDTEQDKAKRVIQSLVSIFVESGLGASRKDSDSAKTFLAEQIKTFEAKLEDSEQRLKEFKLRNLSLQSGDGKDAAARVAEANDQLEAAKLQLHEAENARDSARQQIALQTRAALNVSDGSPAQEEAITKATADIDSRLDAQRRNLDTLLQRYTDQHPDVLAARALIRDLEAQRQKQIQAVRKSLAADRPAAVTLANSSLAEQELSRMLATSEVQVASLKARVAEFASRLAQAKANLKTAPEIEAEAAALNRDYAITKKNYDELVSRRQSAVMSGELDAASGVADFRLIDPPRVDPKPVSPNRLVLVPLVLVLALGLGLFTAFAASQLRPTFDNSEELRLKTGLPLLGVVTLLTDSEDRSRERRSLYRFVAASGGLVGLFVAGLITMTLVTRYGA
jgi:polysaccharide chain length determinant protein (PEP-CTERM system associated)